MTNYLSWAVRFYRPDTGALVSSSLAVRCHPSPACMCHCLCGARIELVPEQASSRRFITLCSNASPGLVKLTLHTWQQLGQQLAAQPWSQAVGHPVRHWR
nr:hypothetical protein [Xanthomonas oryzae]